MNKILFLLILTLISLNTFSQSEKTNNFKIEENEVYWQKIVEFKASKDDYIKILKSNYFFDNLKWNEKLISGKTNSKDLKIRSPYWASFPFDCFTKIEFKENRCRITFSNITFDGPRIEVSGVSQKLNYELSEEGQKNGKFKNSKKNILVLKRLNDFFEAVTSEIENKSDW